MLHLNVLIESLVEGENVMKEGAQATGKTTDIRGLWIKTYLRFNSCLQIKVYFQFNLEIKFPGFGGTIAYQKQYQSYC